MRRNLVLSRRAVLEREKEEARQKLLDSLEPGQVHEGVVRKLMDFGAFVDIGGARRPAARQPVGLEPRQSSPRSASRRARRSRSRSRRSTARTGKIGLVLSRPAGKPLDQRRGQVSAQQHRPRQSHQAHGVRGLRRAGAGRGRARPHLRAFAQAGVAASDVVHEGDDVEVMVLAVNAEAQRISLSMKALSKPEPSKAEKEEAAARQAATLPRRSENHAATNPFRAAWAKAGGDRFGLNW